jgi:dihydropteroate synthase
MAQTEIMGILNVTPDSFFDGGSYAALEQAVERGQLMREEGADWIDVGGASSRPYATEVPVEEELARVLPVVEGLKGHPISIDTYRVEVAEAAVRAGASFINDITGLEEPGMRRLASESGARVCIMHMQGNPTTMQINPSYPRGVVAEVKEWLERRIELVLRSGVRESQIVIDPGIGFGKRIEDNVELIRNVGAFRALGFPILVGASRKGFLSKILGLGVDDLLSATLVVHTMALVGGAAILRVHDVTQHRQMADLNTWF